MLRQSKPVLLLLTAVIGCSESSSGDGGVLDPETDAGVITTDDAGSKPDASTPPDGGTNATRDAGPVASDPFDPSTAASSLALAFCQHRTRCEPGFHDFLREDEAACTAEGTRVRDDLFGVYDAMIRAERLRFVQSSFDECLRSLQNSDCVLGIGDACDTIFVGTLEVSDSCSYGEECGDDGWCEDTGSGRCGTCRASLGHNEICTPGTCARGFVCLQAGGPVPLCVPNNVTEGQPCGTTVTGLCVGRLQCVGGADATCQPPAAAGEACDLSARVRANCNGFQNSICVNGICESTNWVASGLSCERPNRCDVTATCNPMTTVCDPRPGFAEPCTDVCAEGLFCFRDQCVIKRTEGEMCEAATDCRDDLWCTAGICGALTYATCP